MGNKFGAFANEAEAEAAIVAEGFKKNAAGLFVKASMSGGNLFAAPRKMNALVEISKYRVDGQYAADGKDYFVYQHHFL